MSTAVNLTLKRLASLLREADEPVKKERGEDSIDSQIDSYFSDYEAESKKSKNEGRDFRMFVRRFLSEAPEDEEKADTEKDADKDEKKTDAASPEKLSINDIDVDSFAENVVRLIDNYDSLLEVRNTILRRAINHLLDGYQPDVAEAFKESLMENHGLEVGKSKYEREDDNFQPPAADRAGASPGA